MPLYEYKCRKCSKRFEFLVMGSEKPHCPEMPMAAISSGCSPTFAVSGAERKSESDSFGDLGGSGFGGDSDLGGDSDVGGGAGDLGGGDDLGGDPGGADLRRRRPRR